ncbi:MAG: ASCH domain-containing protein [Planctomycetota bacterium]
MLLFKRKFLDAIRRGEKTQTIRLWKHRLMRTGQRSFTPGVGPIRVTLVEEVSLDALTDADAQPDGFATADALRHELRTIYGDKLQAGYQAYRVVFRTEPDEAPGAEAR